MTARSQLPVQLEYSEVWSAALEQLLLAARLAAEHSVDRPVGRSRSVDLRRLAGAVARIDELQRRGEL